MEKTISNFAIKYLDYLEVKNGVFTGNLKEDVPEQIRKEWEADGLICAKMREEEDKLPEFSLLALAREQGIPIDYYIRRGEKVSFEKYLVYDETKPGKKILGLHDNAPEWAKKDWNEWRIKFERDFDIGLVL